MPALRRRPRMFLHMIFARRRRNAASRASSAKGGGKDEELEALKAQLEEEREKRLRAYRLSVPDVIFSRAVHGFRLVQRLMYSPEQTGHAGRRRRTSSR